jgi:hypothetical protein
VFGVAQRLVSLSDTALVLPSRFWYGAIATGRGIRRVAARSLFMDASLTRRQALYELLHKPDPPELHRGFVVRLEGKPDRFAQLPDLAAAFVRAKMTEFRHRPKPRMTS